MTKKFRDLTPPRTDGKKWKLPRRARPPKNVISSEEFFAQVREDVRKNPNLTKGMTRRQKAIVGIK